MAQERDNVKAGIFVLAGILLALVVIFTLSDFKQLFEQRQTVQVYFTLSDGLQGLKHGATVTIGDQPIGEVVDIKDVTEEERNRLGLFPLENQQPQPTNKPTDPARIVGKTVTTSIPKRYKVYEDAIIELNIPPLGTGTKLNIKSVGRDGQPYDPKRSKPIIGSRAGSLLTRNLASDFGIDDQERQEIKDTIANIRAVTAGIREDVPKISKQLQAVLDKDGPLLKNATEAVTHINSITADVDARKKEWFDNIDKITKNANEAITNVNQLLKDKGPQLRDTLDNVNQISKRAKEETMVQVHDALETAKSALADVKKTTEELKTFVVGQRPVLERAMANFSLTSDQLKLTAIEIRRSPWRLLYKPSDDELNTDNLYDAARSFALAAGTLDAASRSLATVSQQNPRDEAQINKMLDHLETLFKRYEEAEDAFWKALQGRKPEGK